MKKLAISINTRIFLLTIAPALLILLILGSITIFSLSSIKPILDEYHLILGIGIFFILSLLFTLFCAIRVSRELLNPLFHLRKLLIKLSEDHLGKRHLLKKNFFNPDKLE